jgi:hypothetical protein
MSDGAAPCPLCKRTLRLVATPPSAFVLTECPSCGASIVLIHSDEAIMLIDAKRASTWRFRRLLHEQGLDIAMSGGSGFALPALGAIVFVTHGQVLAALGAIGVAVAAGLGCASTIALDAKAGARAWHAELARTAHILAVQPEGYRA